MNQSEPTRPRQKVLAEVRKRFIARGYPRLVVSLILALSGLVAFGFSASALRIGFDHMGLRYLAAAITGYLTFLLLIRAWIALHRRHRPRRSPRTTRHGWDVDLPIPDLTGTPSSDVSSQSMLGGGHSGGGGASANWGSPSTSVDGVEVDVDIGLPVLLAIAFLLGSLLAMAYVVYVAPMLLAEVALDAALVAGLYRKLRREDARHWLGSAFRHTWLPAAIVAACLLATGTAFQLAMPEARSIGDVVRALGN